MASALAAIILIVFFILYKLSIVIHFFDIHLITLACAHQPLAIVIGHAPEEILIHVAETMTLAREDEHIETLVRTNEGIDYANSVRRMNVIVDVAVHEHQVSFQVGSYLRISLDRVNKCGISCSYLLLDSVMLLAPPSVINVVVMVSCA